MPGVPVALIAERRLLNRLMQANAVSAADAQPLDGLSWVQSRRLQRLLAADVIREARPGAYYVYAPALAAHLTSRRHRVAFALLIVIGLAALSIYIVN